MMKNIMFLTRVDRTQFIQRLVQYVDKHYIGSKIVLLSDNPYNAGRAYAHEFILVDRDIKSEYLKEIIVKHDITGLFVASNYDLRVLNEMASWLKEKNICYFGADDSSLSVCFSKTEMHDFLKKNNVATPKLYQIDELTQESFPLILKPDDGQGSAHVEEVNSFDMLHILCANNEKTIIQKKIDAPEYTVDCFNDFSGRLVVSVARQRINIDGAHATVCRINGDRKFVDIGNRISKGLNMFGPWNYQAFIVGDEIVVHDINPRIASGINFSIECGIDFHKYIVEYLMGNVIEMEAEHCELSWNDGILSSYTRYVPLIL